MTFKLEPVPMTVVSRKLAKHLELCPACGKTIAKKRADPHQGTPECEVIISRKEMAAAGLEMCASATQAKILEELGIVVEWAPGKVLDKWMLLDAMNAWIDVPKDHQKQKGDVIRLRPYVQQCAFVKKESLRAYACVEGVAISAQLRRNALRIFLGDESAVLAAESVAELAKGGKRSSNYARFLSELVRLRALHPPGGK